MFPMMHLILVSYISSILPVLGFLGLMTDHISNCKLYGKYDSMPISRAIIRERLRWLEHALWMKDGRLPRDSSCRSTVKGQTKGRPLMEWEDVIRMI